MKYGDFSLKFGIPFLIRAEAIGKPGVIHEAEIILQMDGTFIGRNLYTFFEEYVEVDMSMVTENTEVLDWFETETRQCTCDYRGANAWLGCRCGAIVPYDNKNVA